MHSRVGGIQVGWAQPKGSARRRRCCRATNDGRRVKNVEEAGTLESQPLIPLTLAETDAMKRLAQFLLAEEFLAYYADQRQEWIRRANSIYHGACFMEEQIKQGDKVLIPEEMGDLADFVRNLPEVGNMSGNPVTDD